MRTRADCRRWYITAVIRLSSWYPSRVSASHLPRRQPPSSAVALTGVTARASPKYRYGGTSQDQPRTSCCRKKLVPYPPGTSPGGTEPDVLPARSKVPEGAHGPAPPGLPPLGRTQRETPGWAWGRTEG
jgi:hypothetical protein